MPHRMRRSIAASLAAGALGVASIAGLAVISPAVASACPPGYTGITNGCNPFCVPGKFLNAQTGLCEPLPPPPPAPALR